MAITNTKRRRGEEEPRRPKKKIRKFKKQARYDSSSEDDDEDAAAPIRRHAQPSTRTIVPKTKTTTRPTKGTFAKKQSVPEAVVTDPSDDEALDETTVNTALNMAAHESEEDQDSAEDEVAELDTGSEEDELVMDDEDDEPELASDTHSETSTTAAGTARKKRNDPDAFATSISKILTTKLTTQKRSDPILSRSRTAEEATKALADDKLETKARAAIRAEKKTTLERGRVRDVLGLETPGVDTGAIQEEEKRLKKIAQRGVVKLFNAVRAAQIRAEEAENKACEDGVVGIRKREDRVNEMSKEGFLDLISRGGKKATEA